MSLVELESSKEAICEWKIDNFALLPKEWSMLSPIFHMNPDGMVDCTTKWYFNLLFIDDEYENIVSYLIRGQDSGPRIVELCYEISIVALDGSSRRITSSSQPCSFIIFNAGNYFETCGHLTDVDAFLVNGTLTLRCRMWGIGVICPMYCLIRTQINLQKRYFKWIIDGFNSQKKKEYTLTFFHNNIDLLRLEITLSGETSDDDIQIEINCIEKPDEDQYVICQICVLDVEGNVEASKKDNYLFKQEDIWRFPLFIKKEWLVNNKNLCVPNGTLSLGFEIANLWNKGNFDSVEEVSTSFTSGFSTSTIRRKSSIANSCVEPTRENYHFEFASGHVLPVDRSGSDINRPSFGSNSLMKGLLGLYKQRKFCDVALKTNEGTYPVHKAVLCAQSSVFTAMFEQDMKENRSGIVEITDLTDDTIQRLLMFMYTDTLQDIQWESAQKLYTASDKYEIAHLKNLCRSFLKANMNVSNVIDVLVLADLHQDPDLKSASVDFVFDHDSELIDSDLWKRFMQDNFKLASEIIYLLYLRKMKK